MMQVIFSRHFDYILLCYTIILLLLSMLGWTFRDYLGRGAWKYVGFFGLLQAFLALLDMMSLSIGHPGQYQIMRIILQATADSCLIFFACQESGRDRPRACLGISSVLLLLSATGASAGLAGLEAGTGYCLGGIGGLWAAWVLARRSRERLTGRIAAAFLACWAFLEAVDVPASGFPPARYLNSESFLLTTGIPARLLQALCIFGGVITLWRLYRKDLPPAAKRRKGLMFLGSGAWLFGFLALILVCGWMITGLVEHNADTRERQHLIKRTAVAAAALNPDDIKKLSGTPADLNNPVYIHLKEQLQAMRAASKDSRFLYLMAWKQDRVIFLVDSEPSASPDFSPPGQVYAEASVLLKQIFTTGKAAAEGPINDRWGIWITALAPVTDPATKKILAVCGNDINVRDWQYLLNRQRLFPILATLLFSIIIMLFYVDRKNVSLLTLGVAESEARYRGVIENLMDVFLRSDLQGKIVMASPSAQSILGLETLDEIIGQDINSFWENPDEYAWMLTVIKQNGSTRDFRTVWTRKGGALFPVSINARFYTGDNGAIMGVEGFARDITERERAEEAIQESERRYRQIIETASDIVYRTDSRGNITFVNPIATRMTGYTEEELLHKPYLFLIPDEYHEEIADLFTRQYLEDTPNTYSEVPIHTKTGSVIWMGQNVHLLKEEGKITGFQGLARDITDRKHAEEELRLSRERLQVILDNAPAGIVLIDAETHHILEINKSACEMIGAVPKDIIGKECFSCICPAKKGACPVINFKQEVDHSEHIIIRSDGTFVPILKTVVPIMLNNKKVLIESFIDITDRKKAEDQVTEARTRAESKAAELAETVEELKLYNQLSVGRELRMIELKKYINELLPRLGEPPQFDLSELLEKERGHE